MNSLRTRLFVILGAVLAASIAAAGLLSRRATLVEVREVIPPAAKAMRFDAAADGLQQQLRAAGQAAAAAALPAIAREAGRPLLWLDDTRGRVIAGSTRELQDARVAPGAEDGALLIGIKEGARDTSTIVVAGAPERHLRDAAGRTAGVLVGLPAPRLGSDADVRLGVPVWVLTTAAIGLIGLLLTFALSRRILGPVSALTAAARRMEAGNLDVRVNQYARGTDEIANLAHAFNAMAAKLAETERLRQQLVSDVAHELRSPVTNLRCTLEAMQDGLLEPERKNIDALHEETLFLQRLLSDLQDLALAEAGQLPLRSERVDLPALLARVVAPLAQQPGEAPIHSDVPPDFDVTGDPDRLEQVFRNLLANARLHTPAAGRIDVCGRRNSDSIEVEIADTGSGIEAAHLPHVFDRFYRADASRARATGGAGLGLAIARQWIGAHGGTITAHSEGPGKGATFTVRLPARRT